MSNNQHQEMKALYTAREIILSSIELIKDFNFDPNETEDVEEWLKEPLSDEDDGPFFI